MIPNCAATRHAHFVLDGSGRPSSKSRSYPTGLPDLEADASSRRVDLNKLNKAEVASWKPGERLLLSGKMLTGRDAAHKRIQE